MGGSDCKKNQPMPSLVLMPKKLRRNIAAVASRCRQFLAIKRICGNGEYAIMCFTFN